MFNVAYFLISIYSLKTAHIMYTGSLSIFRELAEPVKVIKNYQQRPVQVEGHSLGMCQQQTEETSFILFHEVLKCSPTSH